MALATGAAAMPQSGVADIVYTDLSSSPVQVGFAGGAVSSYPFSDLPGTVDFGLRAFQSTVATGGGTYRYRWVTAGRQAGSVVVGVGATAAGVSAQVLAAGSSWSAGGGPTPAGVFVGYATNYGQQKPDSDYTDQYLAWVFADTTQGGALLYGWIEISLAIAWPPGPTVTLTGYAYDDTPGVKPLMGQIPEPTSTGLLALGALALGSRGLRRWRQSRPQNS
jgi:hypothetical protein